MVEDRRFLDSERAWSDTEKEALDEISKAIEVVGKGSRYRVLFVALQDTQEMDKLGPDRSQLFAHNEEWVGTPKQMAMILLSCYAMYCMVHKVDFGIGVKAFVAALEEKFDIKKPH